MVVRRDVNWLAPARSKTFDSTSTWLWASVYAHCGGFPGGTVCKEPNCQGKRHKRHRFEPWVGRMPWRRAWQSIPVFLPRESQGQRSLAGYSPWGCKRVRHNLATKQQQRKPPLSQPQHTLTQHPFGCLTVNFSTSRLGLSFFHSQEKPREPLALKALDILV